MNLEEGNRIKGESVFIDSNKVKGLFEKRALESKSSLHAVMLQSDDSQIPIERNQTEENLLNQLVSFSAHDVVLDIGCGAGRIASFITDDIKDYYGIDFSENLIEQAKWSFANRSNFHFFADDVSNKTRTKQLISPNTKVSKFFCIAVLLYLNDDDVRKIFEQVAELADNKSEFYLRESISMLDERLTLKDFYSEKLNADYNAIYRTDLEIRTLIKEILEPKGFNIQETNFFAKQNNEYGETSQKFYLIRK